MAPSSLVTTTRTGVAMDHMRRGWSRDEVKVAGVVGLWWYCNLEGWDGFYAKVTEDGEDTLFRRPVDPQEELAMVDLLQHATHVHHENTYREHLRAEFASVLKSAEIPAPFVECLSLLGEHEGDLQEKMSVLEAVGSNKLPRLRALYLSGVDNQSSELLGAAFEFGCLSALKVLSLHNSYHNGGHRKLVDAMDSYHMLALEELVLSYTSMEDRGCRVYAAVIRAGKLPSLAVLDFRGNAIGDDGAKALGRAMGSLGGLKHLDLSENAIGDEGLNALLHSFLDHGEDCGVVPNLQLLDLSWNAFTAVGFQSLLKAISSGRLNSLETLRMRPDRGNRATNFPNSKEAATTLVSALSKLTSLRKVSSNLDKFPALERLMNQHIARNTRITAIMKGLKGCPEVPAAFSKVYICGDPEVGKTTLRKTLQRSLWKSLLTWERRPHVEQRTRGIDVSLVSAKRNKPDENPITLLVWDMAGQNEYHLLHNALFLDLSSATGKATSFVIVCSSDSNLQESKQQLIYWLQFIASSCGNITGNLRHVLVVVNNIGGDPMAIAVRPNWIEFIMRQREVFKDYLDIDDDPIIADVRKYKSVQLLKKRLLDHGRHSLRYERVPEICQFVEQNVHSWSEAKQKFPVLEWNQFVKAVHEQSNEPWAEEKLEAATRYLSEAGVLVYVNLPSNLGDPHRKLVVLNPNWFCKEIAGKMFLHQDMLNPREPLFSKRVDNHGSISISEFKEFFNYSVGDWTDQDFKDLISILLWLGLCYHGRDYRLYIPALIPENGKPVWKYDHTEHQWVMGFTVEHRKSATSLAPIALWHRFQVELAQASRFNGSKDNAFQNGRYFVSFCVDYMNVLVEVSVDQGSPTFDQIGIFVKPLRKTDNVEDKERKQRQVDLAKELVEILLTKVWDNVCPGVEYSERVVWPWPAYQARPKVPETSLEVAEVKKWVDEHGLEKQMQIEVGSDAITGDQLLSTQHKEEMGIVRQGPRQGRKERWEAEIFSSEVAYGESSSVVHDIGEPSEPSEPQFLRRLESMRDELRKEQHLVRALVETNLTVSNENKDLLIEHRDLLHKLQNSVEFFSQDWKRTCPIMIYVEERNSSFWMRMALPWKRYCLRFACEAKFKDDRHHEVMGQQGLDMPQLKEWARTIGAPWLKLSLTILLVSAHIAATAMLPGIGLVIPSFGQNYQQWSAISSGVALATGLSRDHVAQIIARMDADVPSVGQNPQELYGKSMEAISKLLQDLTPKAFKEKVALRKVSLYHDQRSLQKIVWICNECFQKYSDDHTPMKEL